MQTNDTNFVWVLLCQLLRVGKNKDGLGEAIRILQARHDELVGVIIGVMTSMLQSEDLDKVSAAVSEFNGLERHNCHPVFE
eukprot:SAG31_NODE_10637_length_1114_cov_1.878818_3_plen_80_part_01